MNNFDKICMFSALKQALVYTGILFLHEDKTLQAIDVPCLAMELCCLLLHIFG